MKTMGILLFVVWTFFVMTVSMVAVSRQKSIEGGSRHPKPFMELPGGVQKFEDGQATCYIYYDDGISCVVTPKVAYPRTR